MDPRYAPSPELVRNRAIDDLRANGGQLRNHRIMLEAAMANAREAARIADNVGISESRIAVELGISPSTIYRWLRKQQHQ